MRQKIQRLGRILHTREQERDIAQAELRRCRDDEECLEHRVASLDKERLRAMEDFSTLVGQCLSVQDFWYRRQRIACAEGELAAAREVLSQARERVAEAEVVLVERHQSVRMMETYVAKLRTAHDRQCLASEQAAMDDVASVRYRFLVVRP